MGSDNPYEWFTAGEVADLARRLDIVGFPQTKRGVNKWLHRQELADPDGLGEQAKGLSRPRAGQKGGGGLEHSRLLFLGAGKALVEALDGEARVRLAASSPPCEDRHQLTHDDILLMLAKIGVESAHPFDGFPLRKRMVRRSHFVLANSLYYLGRGWNGQEVLVTQAIHTALPGPYTLAFVWRYNPIHGGLAAHGKAGFIGVAEAEPKPDFDWSRVFGWKLGAKG